MRINEKRLLRGPNLYAETPCLMALVDNHGSKGRGFGARLLALMPALPAAAAVRLLDNALLVDALELVIMELQRLAGAPGGYSATLPVCGQSEQRRVVCGYAIEQVASEALRLGAALLAAMARDDAYDLEAAVAALRDTAQRHAVGTSTAAVISAARRRGIPSQRLTDDANLFQLGWGSRQKRLQATITGATNSIAVGIAGDKHLTKTQIGRASCRERVF